MSCENNPNKISSTVAAKTGLTAIQSKAGNLAGRALATYTRQQGKAATRMLAIVGSVDMPRSIDMLMPIAAVGALAVGNKNPSDIARAAVNYNSFFKGRMNDEQAGMATQRYDKELRSQTREAMHDQDRRKSQTRATILNTLAAAQVGRAVATGVGTAIGRLSADKDVPVATEGFFGREGPGGPGPRTVVRTWASKLTPALNAKDIFRYPGVKVKASSGLMIESKGKTWHLGETVAHTPQGKRHITHLQSLNAPQTHYYFSGSVNKWEAVALISGNENFPARSIPGYAGQITEVESLCPGWAQSKKNLIMKHLLWGKIEEPPRDSHQLRQKYTH